MALGAMLAVEQDLAAVSRSLQAAGADELLRLLDEHAAGAASALAVLQRHGEPATVGELERLRAFFDEAVALSPAASVAVYSLGDEALLAVATDEAVGLMQQLGILGPDRELLDIGCGIGRFEQALAPRVGTITGIDISPGMIEAARARCAGLGNVRHALTSGRELGLFGPCSFDAVLAIDSFPYLYRAGGVDLVRGQLREIARVLRAGGDLLVMNLSYRGDLALDRADAAAFAAELGFQLRRNGTSDLRTWDGTTFLFRKPG